MMETTPSPSSTYGWLAKNPLTSSAGSAVYSLYEGSKNYSRVTRFVFDSAESSVKYAAHKAAPLVNQLPLQKPISAVDDFTLRQLQKLETKVPAINKQPIDLLNDSKTAVASGLSDGKDCLVSTISTGKSAVYARVQAGTEAIGNTRAGKLIGYGMDCTLQATDSIVDYVLPAEENEKELISEEEKTEKEEVKTGEEEEEEEMPKTGESDEHSGDGLSRITRVKMLSKKVKIRVYYRSLKRLKIVQEECKTALSYLKLNVDLLKYAHQAQEEMGKQYKNVQERIISIKQQLGALLAKEKDLRWLQVTKDEDEDEEEEMDPKVRQGRLQDALDYAKRLSEMAHDSLQYVGKATAYLPSQLKNGATQAFTQVQEVYSTFAMAKSPSDLPLAVLNKVSGVIKTQLDYLTSLGNYITTALKMRPAGSVAEDPTIEEISSDEEEEEEKQGEDGSGLEEETAETVV